VNSELLLLGHRGDPLRHPENTMAGFASAVACGADGVELDVQVSGDGVAVVIHDDTVELRDLGVPRLDDVLAALRDSVVAVELKASHAAHPDLAERVLRSAEGVRMLLLSFDHPHLAAAKRIDSNVPCGALVRHRPADPLALLDACGADALSLWWEEIDAALCAELGAAGRAVFAWTVDGEADAVALARMGVAVVISNRPCALVPLLRSFRAEG
jgi:glycerophosphoryl diester phosphodiesterase